MTKLLKISLLKLMFVVLGTPVVSIAAMAQDSSSASAGLDSLFYRDGRVEGVIISKSTQESIEFTYPGETMTNEMSKSYFSQIKYHSGRVEDIEANLALSSNESSIVPVKVEKERTKKTHSHITVKYQGDVNVGYAYTYKFIRGRTNGESMTENFSRPLITTTHGVRITDWVFIGLGAGFQYAYATWDTFLIPVYFDARFYYPVSEKFAPYISASAGISFMTSKYIDKWNHIAYYGEYGVGLNYGHLDFSLGLLQQRLPWYIAPSTGGIFKTWSVFAKIGVKF